MSPARVAFIPLTYTNPNNLLFEPPQPNLLPLEKEWYVNLLGLVLCTGYPLEAILTEETQCAAFTVNPKKKFTML